MKQLKNNSSFANRENASLERYLQEISKEEIVSEEEEMELARRSRNGDRQAQERLTKANLRFVVSVAKQYRNQGIALPDLINEGNLGLIKAAEKFDETRGVKFISYAVWWIRQSILQAIAEQGRIVRLPHNQVGSTKKINRMQHDFEQKNERKPSIAEIAERVNMPQAKVSETMRISSHHISVDTPIGEGNNSMIDVMASNDSPSADQKLLLEALRNELVDALDLLNERERNVIKAYYGIGQDEMTMAEIGLKYGFTRERVRQIRKKAIRKLRNNTRSYLLKTYLG